MGIRKISEEYFFLPKRIRLQGVALVFLLLACKHVHKDEVNAIVHSEVSVTLPTVKDTSVFIEYQGITQFTQHLQIRTQTAGIVSKSMVSVSTRIEKNHPLFIIKSREAAILNSSIQQDNILSNMADTVFSFSPGIIDQVLVQQGDFVQEGDLLATSVNENSMRILVSIPLEETITGFQNKSCTIILPDGKYLQGIVGAGLPVANINDQTNQFLVTPVSGIGLSENIHVRVQIKKRDILNGLFVPKTSVYSNEELTNHWVFKIIQDTIAIKIPVITGIELDSLLQITNTDLQLTDQIIFEGGYGLSDSALVNIIQPVKNGK